MKIVIIDYGAGNLSSVRYAIERLGYSAVISDQKTEIESADRVIFPGVGAAGTAMKALREKQLDLLIPQLKQPVLGICLGMQLMCRFTEEDETEGLGIFNTEVKAFSTGALKVPHMGWNTVYTDAKWWHANSDADLYFVHSYYVPLMEHTVANCYYGFLFSAALQQANFYACQFHPEKSGSLGQEVLKNFLNQ